MNEIDETSSRATTLDSLTRKSGPQKDLKIETRVVPGIPFKWKHLITEKFSQ